MEELDAKWQFVYVEAKNKFMELKDTPNKEIGGGGKCTKKAGFLG